MHLILYGPRVIEGVLSIDFNVVIFRATRIKPSGIYYKNLLLFSTLPSSQAALIEFNMKTTLWNKKKNQKQTRN